MEGKGAALIDMVGISQKNGAVVTHLKIAARPEDISAVRVARGHADLILGCDLVTSASERILSAATREKTAAVVNSHETMPAHFTHDANFDVQGGALTLKIAAAVKQGALSAIDATEIATKLLGDSIAANLFTLGFAWQKGLVPLSREAIEAAVKLNGVGVKMNLAAFDWGRRAAVDEQAVRAVIGAKAEKKPETLDDIVARRVDFLTGYQNAAYAGTYRSFIDKVRATSEPLALVVARNLFKLMAYKDEYEVARLYTDGAFAANLAKQFKGDFTLRYHLAPPIMGRVDSFTGKPLKTEFGPWMMTGFRMLAKLKGLRGTALDIFGRTAERKMERQLDRGLSRLDRKPVAKAECGEHADRHRDRRASRNDPWLWPCEGGECREGEDAGGGTGRAVRGQACACEGCGGVSATPAGRSAPPRWRQFARR